MFEAINDIEKMISADGIGLNPITSVVQCTLNLPIYILSIRIGDNHEVFHRTMLVMGYEQFVYTLELCATEDVEVRYVELRYPGYYTGASERWRSEYVTRIERATGLFDSEKIEAAVIHLESGELIYEPSDLEEKDIISTEEFISFNLP